jgi:sigma-B regulation protein RsbU (phosphoserine phosphatase)
MGPLKTATYHRELVHVEPGDLLLLYTDGIVERKNPEQESEWGLEGLVRCARELLAARTDVGRLPMAILDAAKAFGGDLPWEDDVTLVALRRRHPGDRSGEITG